MYNFLNDYLSSACVAKDISTLSPQEVYIYSHAWAKIYFLRELNVLA